MGFPTEGDLPEYFIYKQDKYNHVLKDIFIEWCQIVESNNEKV